MTTDFEICRFHKKQKSRYLENEILVFLQVRKSLNYTTGASLWQKIVLWRRQPGKLIFMLTVLEQRRKNDISLLSNANAFRKAVTLFEYGEIHNDQSNFPPEIAGCSLFPTSSQAHL